MANIGQKLNAHVGPGQIRATNLYSNLFILFPVLTILNVTLLQFTGWITIYKWKKNEYET